MRLLAGVPNYIYIEGEKGLVGSSYSNTGGLIIMQSCVCTLVGGFALVLALSLWQKQL